MVCCRSGAISFQEIGQLIGEDLITKRDGLLELIQGFFPRSKDTEHSAVDDIHTHVSAVNEEQMFH